MLRARTTWMVVGLAALMLTAGPALAGNGSAFLRWAPGAGVNVNFGGGGNDITATVFTNNGDWARQGPDGTIVIHLADNEASLQVITPDGQAMLGMGNFKLSATFRCILFDPDTGLLVGCTADGEKLNMSLQGTVIDSDDDPWSVFGRFLQHEGELRKSEVEVLPAD